MKYAYILETNGEPNDIPNEILGVYTNEHDVIKEEKHIEASSIDPKQRSFIKTKPHKNKSDGTIYFTTIDEKAHEKLANNMLFYRRKPLDNNKAVEDNWYNGFSDN